VKGGEVVEYYVTALYKILISDEKKNQPKNWWSETVVEMLFSLHLECMAECGGGQHNTE
jgi:hypothetical protein